MIRVRMLKLAAGPLGSFEQGREYDLDDGLAGLFVQAGAAEVVALPPPPEAPPEPERAEEVETAVAPSAPEAAVVSKKKRRYMGQE